MERPRFQFIKRNNSDSRETKIIHQFDGRAMPLEPRILEQCAQELSKNFKSLDFDYVIGFAEGGLIPAFSVAQSLRKPLLCSYRVRMILSNEITFSEPHSAIPDHYLYGLRENDRVVIIEDEITTGRTILNAVDALNRSNVKVIGLGSFLLNNLDMNNYSIIKDQIPNFYHLFKIGENFE